MWYGALIIKRTEDIAFVESISCDDCVLVSEPVETARAGVELYLSLEGWAGCSDDCCQSRFWKGSLCRPDSSRSGCSWWDCKMDRDMMKLTQKARFRFGDSS